MLTAIRFAKTDVARIPEDAKQVAALNGTESYPVRTHSQHALESVSGFGLG